MRFLFDKSLNTDDKAELYATTEELQAGMQTIYTVKGLRAS